MDLSGIGILLGVKSPWKLGEVKLQPKNMVIDVFIGIERGTQFDCPNCGQLSPVHDSSIKRIRYLDLFDYRCYLNIQTPRVICARHGVKVSHSDPWSRKGSHYSLKFEAMVLRLCREMSVTAISKELGEPDNNLWRTFHYHVKNKILAGFDFKNVKRVCVDETATKRGHKYVSIFTDYDTGQVLYVTEGRKKDVFSEFYGWLWDKEGHPGAIELFSMDMSISYQAGQKEYFGGAEIVFDRFHIKKCLNKAIDTVRKKEVESTDSLKRTKYIWLKNECNLTEFQRNKLGEFLHESSLDTARAYKLKKGFDQIWNVQSLSVEPLLKSWIKQALEVDLKPITGFINTIKKHYHGILKSMITGITNAVSEGLNSVMQLARSRARGYRNPQNFCAMIYFLGNQ